MVGLIHGPFGERFELVRASEARPSQSVLPDDPILLEAFLFRLLDSPWNEHTLRRAMDAGFGEGMWDGPTLVRLIAERIARGELRIRFLDRQRAPSRGVTGGDDDEREIDEPVSSDPEIHPCDFEAIIFKCSHMPDPEGDSKRDITEIRFWRDGKLDYNNLREPHGGGAPNKVIEVVASHLDRGADDISVTLEGGPGYTCSKTHPKITVIDSVDGSQVFEGETKINFGAKCKALPAPPSLYSSPGALIAYYFFPAQAINAYTVDVESCGVLSDGSMGFGRSQHRIRAYPSDLYELSLSIPSFKKVTYEKEAEDFRSTFQKDAVKTTKKGLDKPLAEIAGDIGASFSFTRSGADIEGSAEIGKTIQTIVQLEKEIRSIMDFVQDFQPAVGWKLSFEVELFKGSLKYEWGYKEWKDHSVYKWWKFNIAMTLIKLALELKFGIELRVWRFGVELVVFGKMTVDAKVSASKEASAADPNPWELAVSSDPKGELGVRGALGADWVTVEGKLEFGLGFKAKCKCSTSKPFSIDWSIDRKETKLQAEGKIKWVGSFSRSKTLVAQKKGWAKGSFPAAEKKLAA